MGWKQWTRERLTSAEVQGFLMDQAVMDFPSAAARDAELVAPTLGMVTYLEDVERYEHRTAVGTWRPLDGYWGSFAIGAAWPAPDTHGARYGDTLYCPELRSHMMFGYSSQWLQCSGPALCGDFAAVDAIRAAAAAAVGSVGNRLHNGFGAMDTAADVLWVANGGNGDPSIWKFAGGSAWNTPMTTASAAAAAGITPATGWSVGGIYVRRTGNLGYLDVTLTRTGAAITVGSNGDVPNSQVLAIPADIAPALNVNACSAASGPATIGYLNGTGLTLTATTPGATIATNGQIQLAVPFYPLSDPTRTFVSSSPFAA